MAFIYNLTDTWNDVTTTWNGIKLAVTNSGSDASSKLLNLTVTGATTASFVVDKSGNLALNGSVNKITMTAPATGATLTLADNSTFITSGAYSSTFTFTGATTLTFPTSGTVTALGNTTTGSGSIVLSNSPSLVTPALGTPSSVTLTNATGLPLTTGVTGTLAIANGGTGQTTANAAFNALAPSQTGNNGKYLTTDGTNTSWATNPLGTVTSVDVSGGATGLTFSGGPITTSGTITMAGTLAVANGGTGLTSLGTGVTTALGVNVGSAGAFVVNGGALGTPSSGTLTNATGLPISTGVSGLGTGVATFLATPSSANLASAVTDETGSGPLVFATSPTFTSQVTLGTQGTTGTQGSLILANTATGSKAVTLKSSNSTAAAYTLTFPAAAPVNGYYLQTDTNGVLSWAAGGGGGGGSPGGSNTQIQYNNAGAFGGSPDFTFVNGSGNATVTLGVGSSTTGKLTLAQSSTANTVTIQSGANTASWTMTLPVDDGNNGQLLQTDGSGNLSWYTNTATGDVVGPASATDNAIARFDGTTGKLIQNSAVTVADTTGDITGGKYNGLTISTTTGTFTIANGKTLAVDNTLTFVGTDASTVSFGAGGTVAYTGGTLAQFASTTSAQLAGVISDETGSGSLVFATSPTLVTPTLGAASATSINKVTITAPATSSTLTIADGKTLTASNTLTFTGTDSSSVAFGTGGTVAYTANNLSVFASTTSAQLAGVISDETGSGALVFGTNPTITNYTESVVAIGNTGTAKTIDLTSGTVQTATLTGNCTFTMPTATAGKSFVLILNTGSSAYTATFTSVKWPNNTAPVATAGSATTRYDIFSFFADGTNWYGSFVQAFQ